MKVQRFNRISIVTLAVVLIFGVGFSTSTYAGLLGPSVDTKKNLVLIKKLGAAEAKLIARYNAVTGKNYKSDAITSKAFMGMLPDLNNFIAKVEDLSPKDSKLQKAVVLWGQAWNKEEEGITLAIAAMQAGDFSKLAASNVALSAAHVLENKAMAAFAPFMK
jgi:hypothetical protein